MNSMESRLLTIITGRLSPAIFECTHGSNIQSINQGDQNYRNKYFFFLLCWLRKLPEYYFLAQAFANLPGKRRQGVYTLGISI